jgi:3-oxoacyl-[acyl-carrier-protein] synthase III
MEASKFALMDGARATVIEAAELIAELRRWQKYAKSAEGVNALIRGESADNATQSEQSASEAKKGSGNT